MLRALTLFLACCANASLAAAQIPRTPEGKPDFQGNWSAAWITPLERPSGTSGLVVPPSETDALYDAIYAQFGVGADGIGPTHSLDVNSLLRVGGEARSSLIIEPEDGKLPLRERARPGGRPAMGTDGPEQRGVSERCLNDGNTVAPFVVLPAGNMKQIVQTRDHVVVLSETMSSLRIIPVHSTARGLAETGRGRWEGDTLVVETSGFAPSDRMRIGRFAQFPISPKSTITERFTRTSSDEIVYRFTVADPDLYTQAWTAEMALRRSDQRLYEWGCQEANYALVNILRGARVTEARAAKAVR
jgi:hypothetical protein